MSLIGKKYLYLVKKVLIQAENVDFVSVHKYVSKKSIKSDFFIKKDIAKFSEISYNILDIVFSDIF